MSYGDPTIERLVGKTIKRIYLNQEYLKFETDQGNVVFTVYGDCCSSSYFHDFLGVRKLLKGSLVISASAVDLAEDDPRAKVEAASYEEVQCYGYEIVTEDPEYGPVTAVFSFRNSSNGYYGGSLENASDETKVEPEITDDVQEVPQS